MFETFSSCWLMLASFCTGGWLLVSNVVVDDPSSRQLWIASSYREISNCHWNKTLFITENAMKELRTHLSFTQMRFHCNKQKGVRREWSSGLSAGLWVGRPGFESWPRHYVVALSKPLHSPCFVFSDKTLSRRSRLLQGLG